MTIQEKISACQEFYNNLCNALSETHENIGSCNQDISAYLIPKGSVADLTYHSKPANSYRISDHWNWYSNLKKCANERYIQCFTTDGPWANKRPAPGKASKPIRMTSVCRFGEDGLYHVIFGDTFNRKTKMWSWNDGSNYLKGER